MLTLASVSGFVAATPPSLEFFVASRFMQRFSLIVIAGDFFIFRIAGEVPELLAFVLLWLGDIEPTDAAPLSVETIRLLRLVLKGVRFLAVS